MAARKITPELSRELLKEPIYDVHDVSANGTHTNNMLYYKWCDDSQDFKTKMSIYRIHHIFDLTYELMDEVKNYRKTYSYKLTYNMIYVMYQILSRANKKLNILYRLVERRGIAYKKQRIEIGKKYISFNIILQFFDRLGKFTKRVVPKKHGDIDVSELKCSLKFREILRDILDEAEDKVRM
jgi:hypothetical protein